jgi:hypothetical protein
MDQQDSIFHHGSQETIEDEPITIDLSSPQGEIDQDIQETAERIQEPAHKIKSRSDITKTIEKLTDGVIVEIEIAFPRFTARTTKAGEQLGLVMTEEGNEILSQYFTLGSHSLLPPAIKQRLSRVETRSRDHLRQHAIKTPWGSFVASEKYIQWKQKNQEDQAEFERIKQEILGNYEEIVREVLDKYQILAGEIWSHGVFGRQVLQQDNFAGLEQKLSFSEYTRDQFIQLYVTEVYRAIPSHQDIEDAFTYKVELGKVPLSATLAKDATQSYQLNRERALKDQDLQSEMAIKREREAAALAKIRNERFLQEETDRKQLEIVQNAALTEQLIKTQQYGTVVREQEAKRKAIEARETMERDAIESIRHKNNEIIEQFYDGVVKEINKKIEDVCKRTLTSLEDSGGILRGTVSKGLVNQVEELKSLNRLIESESAKNMIDLLEKALPTEEQQIRAGKGLQRIDTTPLQKTLRHLDTLVKENLIEVENMPRPRTARPVEDIIETIDTATMPQRRSRQPEENIVITDDHQDHGGGRKIRQF